MGICLPNIERGCDCLHNGALSTRLARYVAIRTSFFLLVSVLALFICDAHSYCTNVSASKVFLKHYFGNIDSVGAPENHNAMIMLCRKV